MSTAARTPGPVGPFCQLPSGKIIGAEYIDGDPTRSTPHQPDCECYRCMHGKPVDVQELLYAHDSLLAALHQVAEFLARSESDEVAWANMRDIVSNAIAKAEGAES